MTDKLFQDPKHRVDLDNALRTLIRGALKSGNVSNIEVVFLLSRMLPELTIAPIAWGHVAAAYDLSILRSEKAISPVNQPSTPHESIPNPQP